MARKLTRGQRVIAWIEKFLRVPEGKFQGQPVRLRPWQRKIILAIYDTPTRLAIVSFGKKNGKTALIACLVLVHLVGPEIRRNSQIYSAAQSRDQAAQVFGYAAKMVRMSVDLDEFVLIRDSSKELLCIEIGTKYHALSADAPTSHGKSPVLLIHDELGQVHGPRSALYEALEMSMSAHDDPLSIVISTQAEDDADLLSVLIDDAQKGEDPRTKLFLWEAPPTIEGEDLYTDATMRLANPAFGDFQNPDELRRQAENARRMPSSEASYRNFVLNQRVTMRSPFVSRSTWDANGKKPASLRGLRVFGGLDLSAVQDLTALVLLGVGKYLEVHPTFWLPENGLRAKAQKDRVPYDQWARDKLLQLAPGSAIEYRWVALRLREVFDEFEVEAIGFDRWGFRFLKPYLLDPDVGGFTEEQVEKHFKPLGQGAATMTPILRELETGLMNKRYRHGMHPVLRMCAVNAVQRGPENARYLDKEKSTGRIDGMVALSMAVGAAGEALQEESLDDFLRDPLIAGRKQQRRKAA